MSTISQNKLKIASFPCIIPIYFPNKQTRVSMLKIFLTENILNDSDFELLAELTENYSPSDLISLARDSSMQPVRDLLNVNRWKFVIKIKYVVLRKRWMTSIFHARKMKKPM